VAAKEDVTYATVTNGAETLVLAEALVEHALGEGWTVEDRFTGADMVGWTYERPFDLVEWPDNHAHFVVIEDYVTTTDGTGLVHQSPAFGEEDFASVRRNNVAMVNPIDESGHFGSDLDLIGGAFFRDANTALLADLEARGLLFRELPYEHSYPHCWRCHTPLLYYAVPAWYIRTTVIKDRLLAENADTNWFPDTIKNGRFGDWLSNNIDWSLSRNRFWGTPLPIWRNDQDPTKLVCIASLAELSELTGRDLADLDPHRPYIDEVTFEIDGETYRRVPEVIDAWFDSGSMPFAQWGYPHVDGSKEKFEQAYPAQYICEAIDQTRGWFYSLMAVGTLVFDQSSYENVVCLGHILAEDGKKMSKHLGNILLPMPLMDEHGADALRWFMACSGSPWSPRRIGHTALTEIVRKVLLTYWNTVAFQSLYARSAGFTPGVTPAPPLSERPILDQWALSEAHRLALDVGASLEEFDTQRAGRLLAAYIDDLSNWYVRRSRRRFWKGDPAALATLHECLYVVTLLMAPLTPFIAERVWQDLYRPTSPELPDSVHLAAWPRIDGSVIDDSLPGPMAIARRLVELGRSARAESGVKTRQPLRRALIGSAAWASLGDELRAQVCEELNIGALESIGVGGADLVDHSAKGNFRNLGKRFGKQTPGVAAAIAAADAAKLATDLSTSGTATISVDGQSVEVGPDDVIISERPREGWSVANDHGETVALDLELDDALRQAGLAREAIRLIQEARKSSGFDVSDRVSLSWTATGDMATALRSHMTEIAEEVLATSVAEVGGAADFSDPELGLGFTLTKV